MTSVREQTASTRRLSRELIIDAALRQIDESGPARLSMRTLAQSLGVEAMSLYRYVRGKEDLLEGVIAVLMDHVATDQGDRITDHWQGYLQQLAHRVRTIAVDHPKAFPLVATRHPAAPWLRPPLRSIAVVETFLSTLIQHGFTDQQAVDAYRAFSSFLLGQLLLESAIRGAETSPPDEPLDEGDATIPAEDGRITLDGSPEIQRLRDLLSEDRSDQEFEITLEALLDRLESRIAQ